MATLLHVLMGFGAFILAYFAYMFVIATIRLKPIPPQPLTVSVGRLTTPSTSQRQDVSFDAHGSSIHAWLYLPGNTGRPAPCVVMAHGLGCTKALGLDRYATRFREAGIAVLAFDYRHLGISEGEPRQLVWIPKQLEDYTVAIAFARQHPAIDADRVALWGTSLSGGHVLTMAARDNDLACVIAQVPLLGGHGGNGMEGIRKYGGIRFLLRMAFIHGVRDLVRSWLRLSPHRIPLAGKPGTTAAMPLAEAWHLLSELAPDDFVNEVCARILIRMDKYAPIKGLSDVRCPVLLQICDQDITTTPPKAVERAERELDELAHVLHYPIDHFDIYLDEWFEQAVADQVEFLRACLLAGEC